MTNLSQSWYYIIIYSYNSYTHFNSSTCTPSYSCPYPVSKSSSSSVMQGYISKFKSSFRMGEECDLSGFDCGMVVLCQTGRTARLVWAVTIVTVTNNHSLQWWWEEKHLRMRSTLNFGADVLQQLKTRTGTRGCSGPTLTKTGQLWIGIRPRNTSQASAVYLMWILTESLDLNLHDCTCCTPDAWLTDWIIVFLAS